MKILTVDDYQRVRLPSDVKPRTKLAYEKDANGVIHLTEVAASEKPIRARLIKKNGYLLATTDRPITNEMVKESLADFP